MAAVGTRDAGVRRGHAGFLAPPAAVRREDTRTLPSSRGTAIAHARSGGAVGLSGRRRKADTELIWPRRRPSGGGGGLGGTQRLLGLCGRRKNEGHGRDKRGTHGGFLGLFSRRSLEGGERTRTQDAAIFREISVCACAGPAGRGLWAPPAAVGGTRWGAGADSSINIYGGLAAFGGVRGLFRGSGGRKGRMGGLRTF